MNADQALRVSRILGMSLLFGVLLFAGIVYVLTGSGSAIDGGEADWQFLIKAWYVVAAVLVAAWYLLWRKATCHTESPASRPAAGGPERVIRLLIIAWAMLEGAALLGVTVALLTGQRSMLTAAVVLMLAGMAVSFPRAEWFASFRASGADANHS
jgi:hypothetical protein